MSTPHKCPACDGYGKRANPEMYASRFASGTSAVPPSTIPCPACGGTGIIWDYGNIVLSDEEVGTVSYPDTPAGGGEEG